jgi:hypothetical protein
MGSAFARIYFRIDYALPFSFHLAIEASHAIVAPPNLFLRVGCANMYAYTCVISRAIRQCVPPQCVRHCLPFSGAVYRDTDSVQT